MAFDGTEGDPITLITGGTMTAKFRLNYPNLTKGCFFGKDLLNQILAQTGCMGIRMYFAQDSNNVLQLVIVGADASEDDMCNLIGDVSVLCPPRCGNRNSLNS
jgi:hypothetical protein